MIVGAFSERLYKKDMNPEVVNKLHELLRECNNAKHYAYSVLVRGKNVSLKSEGKDIVNTTAVREHNKLNTYYANMAIRNAKAARSSNTALKDSQIESLNSQIENREHKITKNNESIKRKLELIDKIKNIDINQWKDGQTVFCDFPYQFVKKNDSVVVYAVNKKNAAPVRLHAFECDQKLKIKRLKNSNAKMKLAIDRYKARMKVLENKPYMSCFGGKGFFRNQPTIRLDDYDNLHTKWRNEWQRRRHKSFVISGCDGHTDGSDCVRYNPEKKIISIMDIRDYPNEKLQRIKNADGTVEERLVVCKHAKHKFIEFPCEFRYRESEYLENIALKRNVSYEITDHGDYFIIIASFEMKFDNDENRINDSLDDGVIAADLNVDCFAVADISKDGNLLDHKVIRFDLRNLTSNQSTKELERAALELVQFCKEKKKPLILEDLKKIQFKNTSDAKRNKLLTQFAYTKMISIIERAMEKNCYKVFKINPMYTSQQGKIKYMARYGLSIHESAAFCIGRKFLFSTENKTYYERLDDFAKFGKIASVSKALKELKVKDFYILHKLPVYPSEYKTIQKYIKAVKEVINNKVLLEPLPT